MKASTKPKSAATTDLSLEKENTRLREELDRAAEFVQEIKSGNLAATYESLLGRHPLGKSLLLLRNQMASLLTQEQQRNWSNEGIARFAEILRKRQQESLATLLNEVLIQLIEYIGASQGVLSVLKEDNGRQYLESISHYASKKKLKDKQRFEIGEGLAGQVMVTRKEIYLEEIPKGYLTIASSLGKSAPASALVMPLLLDTEAMGVIELALFKKLQPYEIEFVKKIGEAIASAYFNMRINERTRMLLAESQEKELQLKEQEAELRKNMNQLFASREEILKIQLETEAQTKIINSLAIVSKADIRGDITYVNDEFVKWSKYTREEVMGKNHRFLKSGDQDDSIFVDLWKTISSGRVWRGEIKNKAKDGSYYWVDAIIAPVLGPNGKPKEYIAQRFVINDKKAREAEVNALLTESQSIQGKMQMLMNETEAQTKIINSLAIVSRADVRGDITYVNDEFVKWSKYTREEVMGKNHRLLKSGDQDDAIFADLWKTISRGKTWRGEIKNKAKDGSYYWVDAIIAPVLGADGKPKEYIAQRFVINDKKDREAKVNLLLAESQAKEEVLRNNMIALEETQARLSQLMKETEAQTNIINSIAIVSKADVRGDITYVNDEFVRWSKYSREEVIGKNHRLLKSGDQHDSIFTDLWRTISKGNTWRGEIKNKAKDGSFYWVDAIIAPVLDENGKPKEYIAQRFVINDKKEREDEMNLQNQLITQAHEKLNQSFQELQVAQEQIVQTEKMAFLGRLTSGVAHEINTPLGAIKASSENVQVAMEGILKKTQQVLEFIPREQVTLLFELVKQAGESRNILTSAQRRAARREVAGQLQELQLEQLEAVAEFVVLLGISENVMAWRSILVLPHVHEILGLVYDIVSVKEQNQNIGVAVSKAAKILFALKKYSHQGHEEAATEFDVADNLETVMAIYSNNLKQIEVVKDFEPVNKINGYPDELNQVWTNLIHNSLQAMDGKGKMEFKIRAHISGGAVIEVTDYGKGIASENLAKVFDPFFTTKAPGEGTGLGLSIVKKIIDKHDGTIECESAVGRGTTFRIVLPVN
ncbi:MAG: PAS domain-containing protein [Cyclobacteriaceae bacterium]|nr:PAS domain-containing protein [Cyclobacteriaceae bacterium]